MPAEEKSTAIVPLYIINQTQNAMSEVWISYAGKKQIVTTNTDASGKKASKSRKREIVEQNFYVSTPIPVGPTLTFIGNIQVPVENPDQADIDAEAAGPRRAQFSWMIYWRDEVNSLNGLKQQVMAKIDSKDGLVSLYVVGKSPSTKGATPEQIVRVNQEGKTIDHEDWETLLYVPVPDEEGETDDQPSDAEVA